MNGGTLSLDLEEELTGAVVGEWRPITEDDLLYCVLFSGEGEPHTNEEYCRKMPYQRRMFYGDATLAISLNEMLNHPEFPLIDATVNDIAVRYTDRLYIGDSMRTAFVTDGANETLPDGREAASVTLLVLGANAVAMKASLKASGTPKSIVKGVA